MLYLRTSAPIEVTGPRGSIMPEGDLTWKHIRLQGVHVIVGFAYFKANLGLKGQNLEMLSRISALRDNGKRG